ncbi:NAD(P)H-dependent oxidoreductase subunit E [Spirochaeta isovalerica]|uniref:NADH-quinone oxidoreductase subunit F n=1 Tax=Spirochaeta isovalerica TaxID=150 RepID=A0A841R6W6_9SPIO|nr:NAD(P)H-dependent oxidoreductase subunit E [Spirochaeta isovalerica]MBB6478947.1 NADH-quinone oxidoreductase subunit F [Spirochaeta isovalerica]
MNSISLLPLKTYLDELEDKSRTSLLPALLKAQELYSYIPEEASLLISDRLKVPPVHIYGVIDFYSLLHTEPVQKPHIQVCVSPVCSSRGSHKIIEALRKTDEKKRIYVEAVHCLGLCTNPPSALVDGKQICRVSADKIDDLIAGRGAPPVNNSRSSHPVLTGRFEHDNGISLESYRKSGGFSGLKNALSMERNKVVDLVKNSGLLGRGGAAFPTGLKEESSARDGKTDVYIICNADESEPGTFKDRVLLQRDPFSILEGMIITAYAIGSNKGFIYIRGEYEAEQKRFAEAIRDAEKNSLLGNSILGSDLSFHVEIRSGAGAYICGEETALFESIEGKRGFPRNKPPYPVNSGLFGKPTDINNVETFSYISHILARSDYAPDELPSPSGTRLFCLSGDVKRPGLYELPFGTPLSDVIYKWGGGIIKDRDPGQIILGGASGSFVPPEHYDIPLDNQSLKKAGLSMGSGVIMVFDDSRSILSLLEDITSFFNHESCGKCYPCRLGTGIQKEIISRIHKNGPEKGDLEKLEDIGMTMKDASLCGLGQTASTAVLSAIALKPELFGKERQS